MPASRHESRSGVRMRCSGRDSIDAETLEMATGVSGCIGSSKPASAASSDSVTEECQRLAARNAISISSGNLPWRASI